MTEFLFLARLAGDGQSGLASAQDPVNGINKEAVEHVVADLARLNQYSCPVENIESARQRFIEGKTVIYFNGVWESEALEQSKLSDDYDCAAYPLELSESRLESLVRCAFATASALGNSESKA